MVWRHPSGRERILRPEKNFFVARRFPRIMLVMMLSTAICYTKLVVQSAADGIQNFDEGAASSSFDRHWPAMKQLMCPNMTPNPKVWASLFISARIELGFDSDRTYYLDDAVARFFIFHTGGVLYSSPGGDDRVAYLRVWKAGNDQIRFNLEEILGKRNDGSSVLMDGKTVALLRGLTAEQLNRTCIVTTVRDPVEHFISGYNEMELRNSASFAESRAGVAPRFRNLKNPLPYNRHGNGTMERFETFVSDFIGNTHNTGAYLFDLVHVFSMTGVLWGLKQIRECSGRNARLAGYLPTLKDLDTEFPKFLQRTCPEAPRFDSFPKKREHESQSDPDNNRAAAKRVWQKQGNVSRALCAIHALDYACFDEIPVPNLCQSVYSSQHFRDHLLHTNLTSLETRSTVFCPIQFVEMWSPFLPRPAKALPFERQQ